MSEQNQKYDLVIAGAGPVGCVIAERAARLLGWKVLIVDRRKHIAGNCYDTHHESGVLIHKYGPHYFRTNKPELLHYLSYFTEWIEGNYIVKSAIDGELYPFPINLLTLRQFFKQPDLTAEQASVLLESKREHIGHPKNSEEFVLSRVGRELYEAFYLGYTMKQWGIHPRDLAPSVCGRIPIRLNEDERYVDHGFQVTPAKGFTAMFANMIKHPNIEVMLETDFNDIKNSVRPKRALVYTGSIDEYFDHKLGKLPWRSLEFVFKEEDKEFVQPCVQINHPTDEQDYTRSVEIKHVTGQQHPHTVVSYEYSRTEGDPYYPVPMEANAKLYEQYKVLAEEETRKNHVFFCGRLAEYKYYNVDEVIERAFHTFNTIRERYEHQ
ncbi:MAG: UDP-galactopyranose mutase [Bacteroidota bacterium]